MLYSQITTFFGSQCKFKMSCLRRNCCAARKMWFQLFFSQSTSFAHLMVIVTPGVCLSPRPVPGVAPAAIEGAGWACLDWEFSHPWEKHHLINSITTKTVCGGLWSCPAGGDNYCPHCTGLCFGELKLDLTLHRLQAGANVM